MKGRKYMCIQWTEDFMEFIRDDEQWRIDIVRMKIHTPIQKRRFCVEVWRKELARYVREREAYFEDFDNMVQYAARHMAVLVHGDNLSANASREEVSEMAEYVRKKVLKLKKIRKDEENTR